MIDSRLKERYSYCGIQPKHFTMTFDAWVGNSDLKDTLLGWIQSPEKENLMLCGKTGTGKTYGMVATALEVGVRERIWFVRCVDLMCHLREAARWEYDETPESVIRDMVNEEGYLFIDDIGSERPTEFVEEKLYDLFDRIELSQRNKVIITTNLSPEELSDKLGSRTAYRLIDNFKPIIVEGKNRRIK